MQVIPSPARRGTLSGAANARPSETVWSGLWIDEPGAYTLVALASMRNCFVSQPIVVAP